MNFLFDHDVPDDLAFSLAALGHSRVRLRDVLPIRTPDEEVLRYAADHGQVLITCNRDDFLQAGQRVAHAGIIILIRRRSRAQERAALVRLLDRAGETGIRRNINFA